MPTQYVTIPIFFNQRKTYEICPNNTPVSVRLKQFVITGVQGTNVGDVFALRLGSGWVYESFYICRDNSVNVGPNPNVNKISGTKDIPLLIDASPTTSHEFNNPIILTNNRGMSNPTYILEPVIVLGNDGFTEPIYEKAVVVLEVDYKQDVYGTTDLSIINSHWRN